MDSRRPTGGPRDVPAHLRPEDKRVGVTTRGPDEIDTVLAGHYGFTAEELDFILNYDIKYRLGRDAGDEE